MAKKIVLFGALFVVLFLGIVGQKWYRYVNGTEPYDEVGINLNSMAPGFVREWGCDRLALHNPGTRAPYGCVQKPRKR